MAIRTDSGSLQRIKEEKEYHMKSKIFSDKFFNSQFWKLAVPIMIQSLMLASVATADAAKISSAAVVLNIILNWILMFGGFGITAMGVQGAALATLIARVTELACCVCLSLRKGYIRLNLAGLWKAYPVLTGDFVRCLLPMIGAALLWGVGFTSYTAFMGHMGTDAAAANSIASVVRDLVCCMCNGLASGGGTGSLCISLAGGGGVCLYLSG